MSTFWVEFVLAIVAAVSAHDQDMSRSKYVNQVALEERSDTGSDVSDAQVTTSVLHCAKVCMEDHKCKYFAVSRREGGGHHCLKNDCAENVPRGDWTFYEMTVKKGWKEMSGRRFLSRINGTVDFKQSWSSYKAGFGNPEGEYWMGLDKLHAVTNEYSYGLKVRITAWDGTVLRAYYSSFRVGPESDNYRLNVSGYDIVCSNAGDSLAFHNGMAFSTIDRDNDRFGGGSCARERDGAWWYNYCAYCNPTSPYQPGAVATAAGQELSWCYAPGYHTGYSFKEIIFSLM